MGLVAIATLGAAIVLPRRAPRHPRRPRLLAVTLALVLLVGSGLAAVNQHVQRFPTWVSLMTPADASSGSQVPSGSHVPSATPGVVRVPVSSDNPHPQGLLTTMQLPGATSSYATVHVWLPPQYFEASQRHTRFAVLLMISSVHSDGGSGVRMFDPVHTMLPAIMNGDASPFIAVYAGAMIHPKREAECIDLPGSDTQTVLTQTLPQQVERHYRAASGSQWFVGGISTGAYCAANFVYRHPDAFRAGFGMGPYFHPSFDDLSILGSLPMAEIVRQNAPIAAARAGTLTTFPFLAIMSRQDVQSWGGPGAPHDPGQPPAADGAEFHRLAAGVPGAAFLLLDKGPHSPKTYLPTMPTALRWLGARGL